jgi:hypothetical protein
VDTVEPGSAAETNSYRLDLKGTLEKAEETNGMKFIAIAITRLMRLSVNSQRFIH